MTHKSFVSILLSILLSIGFAAADGFPKTEVLLRENDILLDGLPSSGIGSFATPQRPILLNPAAMAAVPQTQFAADYQRYYWGIGEPLYSSSILYVHHLLNRGFGISMGFFSAGKMTTQSYGLHYGQRLTKPKSPIAETRRLGLFGGATVRLRRRAFSLSDFRLSDPNDPLFNDGTSRSALSVGLGLIYRAADWSAYLCGDDLDSPNLAIEDGAEDRLPMQLQAGAEFELPWGAIRLSPVVTYRSEYGDFGKEIDPTLAIRRDFADGRMGLRIFLGRWAIGAGATYYLSVGEGPGVRYELSQPTTGIATPSHRLAATYRFQPPPPAYPDLLVSDIELAGAPLSSDTIVLRVALRNDGPRDAKDFPVSIRIGGEPLDAIRATIPAGETATVEAEWLPPDSGEFTVVARADDAGDAFPDYDGRILELDEENNELSRRFRIYGPPSARLSVSGKELRVTQRITVMEDEPVIPIVFFDAGSDEIDPRFDGLIDNIAERLAENPEAHLRVEGYYAPDDPDGAEAKGIKLADSRAKRVLEALVRANPEIKGRVELSIYHDRSRNRAIKEKFQGTRKGKIYTAQENRRVELRVEPEPPNEWLLRAFDLNDIDIERLRKRLFENPLFEIVAVAPTLDSAFSVEKRLAKIVGERFADRVYSREAPDKEAEIILTASGILYEPKMLEVPDENLTIEDGSGRSAFELSVSGGGDVDGARIVIEDGRGHEVRKLDVEGRNAAWDWTDSTGGLVDPNNIYIAKAELSDEFGQKAISNPETLRVVLTNRMDISGRLILVQFAFAGAFGEPDYASVRMEELTRKIIERIENGGFLDVTIGGHTDIVGVESGNMELSQRRADEQFAAFRRYMMKILGMVDEGRLDAWLAEHNSTMSAKGYGPSKPYSIVRGKGDDAHRVEIGNNELPEGRIVNRRVEIEFTPIGNAQRRNK